MKIGTIIQARISSTRLPFKVLKKLPYNSNLTVLDQMIRRVKKTKLVESIIIATTTEPEDEQIIEIAKRNKVDFIKESKEDVLSRYYYAAKKFNLDIIVRLTGDCPCIDWNIIDNVVQVYKDGNFDFVSNVLERTFPYGLDVEVFSLKVLQEAFLNAKEYKHREHVTPYIFLSGKFKIKNVCAPKEFHKPEIRITLDTEEDYALLCVVYDFLYPKNIFFDTYDIIKLFKEKPWLYLINKKVVHKKLFNSFEEEVKEAIRVLDLQELKRVKNFLQEKLRR